MAYASTDWRAEHKFLYGAHPWSITHAFTASANAADADDMATDLVTDWLATMDGQYAASVSYEGVVIRNRVDNSFVGLNSVSNAGSLAGSETLPMGIAMCVSLKTATHTRRGSGRFYVSGRVVPQDLVVGDHNAWVTAARTSLRNAVLAYQTALNAAHSGGRTYELCVDSRLDTVLRPVTGVEVDSLVDVQRRRLRD